MSVSINNYYACMQDAKVLSLGLFAPARQRAAGGQVLRMPRPPTDNLLRAGISQTRRMCIWCIIADSESIQAVV